MSDAAHRPPAATRQAGLERLAAFAPHAGGAYREGRNFDPGPTAPQAVSRLSPYLQRRLVAEAEVIEQVCAAVRPQAAEMFLQEVLWRTYWKGWLAHHPEIWGDYVAGRDRARAATGGMAQAIASAMAGRCGLPVMDAWAQELVTYNTLHNHTRMWFASIWIFTLKLPWEAGADFFHRHLLDGDAASNTLSWRWVAGLQTPGKHYLARAGNIAKFTDGRWPQVTGLAEDAPPIAEKGHGPTAAAPVIMPGPAQRPAGRTGLLVTPEDMSLEAGELAGWQVAAVAAMGPAWVAGPLRSAPEVVRFGEDAAGDAGERAGAHFAAPVAQLRPDGGEDVAQQAVARVLQWAQEQRLTAVALPAPRVGPWRDLLGDAGERLAGAGIQVVPVLRAHDLALYPWATRGFFHFKKHALWPAVRSPRAPEVSPPRRQR